MLIKYFDGQTVDSVTSDIISMIKLLPTDNILVIDKAINDYIKERIRIKLEKTY